MKNFLNYFTSVFYFYLWRFIKATTVWELLYVKTAFRHIWRNVCVYEYKLIYIEMHNEEHNEELKKISNIGVKYMTFLQNIVLHIKSLNCLHFCFQQLNLIVLSTFLQKVIYLKLSRKYHYFHRLVSLNKIWTEYVVLQRFVFSFIILLHLIFQHMTPLK